MKTEIGQIRVRTLVLSISLTCSLWAQTDSGAHKPNDTKPQALVVVAAVDKDTGGTARLRSEGKPHDNSFVIGADDVLAVSVWKEPEISRVGPVRSDGKISLPLVGEVQASGRTPKQLEAEITAKLKDYVSEPQVAVIVQEIKSQKFNVLGMVMRPGSYMLTNPTTVLDAIAMVGGFRDFAKQKNIYVLRRTADGSQTRLSFNYKDVVKGKDSAQNIELQPSDTVVVP